MAYTKPLGGIVSTAQAAAAVARDPYLPQVVGLVLELEKHESGGSSSSSSSGGGSAGVGLRNVVGPLRMFVAVQKRPWILPAAVAGTFALVFAAGYYTRKTVAK